MVTLKQNFFVSDLSFKKLRIFNFKLKSVIFVAGEGIPVIFGQSSSQLFAYPS
jgi:hypothetical protein